MYSHIVLIKGKSYIILFDSTITENESHIYRYRTCFEFRLFQIRVGLKSNVINLQMNNSYMYFPS